MTDLRMEEIDSGLTIVEVAKQLEYPPVLVIFTGYATEEVAQRGLNLRIDYLATKPVDPDKLFLALERLLERRELLARQESAS
jgi:CheY-like chemotaxis protein